MASFGEKPTPEMNELLRATASRRPEVATAAMRELAMAMTDPIRKGVLDGDIWSDIFTDKPFDHGRSFEFPIDFLSPGSEKDHVAYTIPTVGALPKRHIEADYVNIPVYDYGNTISWDLRYAENCDWDMVGRAMQVYEAGFLRKENADAWHVILAAGKNRNIVVYDSAAAAGLFTKRVVSLLQLKMRRSNGGNSSSINRGKLTDIYLSPECIEDVRSWDLSQVDDVTRREIYLAGEGGSAVTRIFRANLHDLDELGVDQEFQDYFTDTLGGSLPGSKVELLVGLDKARPWSFVSPSKGQLETFEDMSMHPMRRAGVYGWKSRGFANLESRSVMLAAA